MALSKQAPSQALLTPERVRVSRSSWIKQMLRLGRHSEFSLVGREWLRGMLDHNSSREVWVMSRQVGKSSNSLNKEMYLIATIPGFFMLYLAPELKQVYKFSHERVDGVLKSSPVMRSLKGDLDNKLEKSFSNGSRYYMMAFAHNPESVRGLTVDGVHYDEAQDQDIEGSGPVVEEATFTSRYKYRFVTGTPKSHNNALTRVEWARSTQNEWLVKCPKCPVDKGRMILLGLSNVGRHGPTCHKCGSSLNVDDGMWVERFPNAADIDPVDRRQPGFRVHQMQCGDSHRTAEDWLAYRLKVNNYSEAKLLNEVFGLPADIDQRPVTDELLRSISDETYVMTDDPPAWAMKTPRFGGVDWGHGEAATTLCIGAFRNGRFTVLYMQKWEGKQAADHICIPQIARQLKIWSVKRCHCDYGGGFGLNSQLQRAWGVQDTDQLTTNCWSAGIKSDETKWDTGKDPFMLVVNKSKVMMDTIHAMRQKHIAMPAFESYMHVRSLITNVAIERNKKDDPIFIKAGNDDMWQAINYAYLIARIQSS